MMIELRQPLFCTRMTTCCCARPQARASLEQAASLALERKVLLLEAFALEALLLLPCDGDAHAEETRRAQRPRPLPAVDAQPKKTAVRICAYAHRQECAMATAAAATKSE